MWQSDAYTNGHSAFANADTYGNSNCDGAFAHTDGNSYAHSDSNTYCYSNGRSA